MFALTLRNAMSNGLDIRIYMIMDFLKLVLNKKMIKRNNQRWTKKDILFMIARKFEILE